MSQNAIGVSIPVPVNQGGTAATTAPNALTNLGAVPQAGGTMTGALILNADPTLALGAATKQYVDTLASGITIKAPCVCGTTGALTATYANGAAGVGATLTNADVQAAFSVDGISPNVNDRVLIKNQASPFENGIYTVTDVGSGATNWVLTRATDYDTPAEIQPGNLVIISTGTVNAITSWIETATVVTIGTDPIVFTQFSAGVGANTSLSNLTSVSINTSLLPGADDTIDLGSAAKRWRNALVDTVQTGTTAAQTTLLQAYNTNTASYTTFGTLTANNPPTMSLASAVTGITQAASDNSTKLATTAYADTQVTTIAANKALSNLSGVAVNASLIPGADDTLDIGSPSARWNDINCSKIIAGQTNGQSLAYKAYDTGIADYSSFVTAYTGNPATFYISGQNNSSLAYTNFVVVSNGNPPTCAITATTLAFSPTTGGIIGTTTADNADAGKVGEFISSNIVAGSSIAYTTSGVEQNLTSISLTAGDWDVWGNINYFPAPGTVMTGLYTGISTTSATLPDASLLVVEGITLPPSVNYGQMAPQQRINVSGTTTVYMVGLAFFTTSTLNFSGGIYARRAR